MMSKCPACGRLRELEERGGEMGEGYATVTMCAECWKTVDALTGKLRKDEQNR